MWTWTISGVFKAFNVFTNVSFTHHSYHGRTWAHEIDRFAFEWLHSSVGDRTAPALYRLWVQILLKPSGIFLVHIWDCCLNFNSRTVSSIDIFCCCLLCFLGIYWELWPFHSSFKFIQPCEGKIRQNHCCQFKLSLPESWVVRLWCLLRYEKEIYLFCSILVFENTKRKGVKDNHFLMQTWPVLRSGRQLLIKWSNNILEPTINR